LGILALFIQFSGITAGIYFIIFKAASFIIATVLKYVPDKLWAFKKSSTSNVAKEFIQFFVVTFIGLGINVLVASFIVNQIGPQWGLPDKLWANLGGIGAVLVTFCLEFAGYKFFDIQKVNLNPCSRANNPKNDMENLVLYRKYRPQSFADVIGQEHVTVTIANEIKSGHVAHAYLFSGPRGCGKTTTARIIAKAVNCLNRKPDEAEPCNKCANCLEIQSGRAIDLIEIDAASHRGIDDIRELREGIKFAPTKLKYKVFIIDECHQLSKDAANCLIENPGRAAGARDFYTGDHRNCTKFCRPFCRVANGLIS